MKPTDAAPASTAKTGVQLRSLEVNDRVCIPVSAALVRNFSAARPGLRTEIAYRRRLSMRGSACKAKRRPLAKSPLKVANVRGLLTGAIDVLGTLRTADTCCGLAFRARHGAGLESIGAIRRAGPDCGPGGGLGGVLRSKCQRAAAKGEGSQSNKHFYATHFFLSIDDRLFICAPNLRGPKAKKDNNISFSRHNHAESQSPI
jgi:hypothetical protein